MGEATFLPARPWLVAKRVNGGPWLSFGSFPSRAEADAAAQAGAAFHAERCPSDVVEWSVTQ